MKAVIWHAYGSPDVLSLGEAAQPVPKANEVLVKVHASAVTAGDSRMRGLNVPSGLGPLMRLVLGVFRPRKKIPGMDFAGDVVAVGGQVGLFDVGDRVFGSTGIALGAHAEYICIQESKALIKIPETVSYTDAAALVFGGVTALHFLQTRVRTGTRVLINGAAGAVGTAAVQLCCHAGAQVTAVCSGSKVALVKALGADKTIDYTQAPVLNEDSAYDLIFDAVGNLSYSHCKKKLTSAGQLVLINAGLDVLLASSLNRQVVCGAALENKLLLQTLLDLYLAGHLVPVIDRIYRLDEIVAAHGYVDTGRKTGSVVLTIA